VSWLLDTNILSELRKGTRCNSNVAAWFAELEDEDIHLSVLVLGEIRRGVERIRPRDARAAQSLERWLVRLATDYGERILPIDGSVAEEWGRMNVSRPRSAVDSMLSATAKIHDLTLATRNVKHVAGLGARYLNPFDGTKGA
jgi:predicted nucleic acid-binding protein